MSSETSEVDNTLSDGTRAPDASGGGILQRLRDLSVRSKFLIMMLLTSLLSLGTVSYIGSKTGRDALHESISGQLTSLTADKKQQVESYFENMRNIVGVIGSNIFVAQGVQAFRSSYEQVKNTPASDELRGALKSYYKDLFLPRLQENSSGPQMFEEYYPTSSSAESLQAYLIAGNPYAVGEKEKLVEPEDLTNYSLIHAPYHKWFREVAHKHDFYDVFLIDATSDVIVYSVEKEVDFATSMTNGPYAQSSLARLYRKIKNAPRRGQVEIADYERYVPSYNTPSGFVATPVFFGRKFVGVMAAQISIRAINSFVNKDEKWREQGLRETGEIYIVGPDMLMRSNSRFMVQDPSRLERRLKAQNVDLVQISRAMRNKSTVLNVPVESEAARAALAGDTDIKLVTDYRGVSVMSAYAPLEVPGLNWVILSEMDENEAFATQRDFQRLLMIAAAGLTLLVTLGSMLLARRFLRPINTLVAGISGLREGKSDVQIEKVSNDEFGELTDAFNAMSHEIHKRDEVIETKSRSYEAILRRIFPDAVADRLKTGKGNSVESFPQVSTVYIILSGFDAVAKETDGQTSFDLLNELVEMFDNEAEKLGVEKVKTIGDHYLATCGLTVPRLDHARLVVQFVENLAGVVRRHNAAQETKITLRAGIHSGLVHAGIVGNRKFVYDVWGPSVNVARRIVYEADLGSLRITSDALAQLGDDSDFDPEYIVKTRTMGHIPTRRKLLDVGIRSDDLFTQPSRQAAE